jgi:hypothetical protein
MLVLLDPRQERTAPHQLAPPKGEGRDGGTAAHATGDGFADMRLGAVQQPGNIGERQQVKIR